MEIRLIAFFAETPLPPPQLFAVFERTRCHVLWSFPSRATPRDTRLSCVERQVDDEHAAALARCTAHSAYVPHRRSPHPSDERYLSGLHINASDIAKKLYEDLMHTYDKRVSSERCVQGEPTVLCTGPTGVQRHRDVERGDQLERLAVDRRGKSSARMV